MNAQTTPLTEEQLDAQRCKRCGHRSDWHSYFEGECPDDDAPHFDSIAWEAAMFAQEREET